MICWDSSPVLVNTIFEAENCQPPHIKIQSLIEVNLEWNLAPL